MIKDYQIEMINVEDGDSFVVYYTTDDGAKHLVLIDAGRHRTGDRVLNHLRRNHKGEEIELAIVTHPDEDHYGGFVYLLEQIRDKNIAAFPIKHFWLNDPRKHISLDDVKEEIQKQTLEERLKEIYAADDTDLISLLEECKIPYREVFTEAIRVGVGLDEYGKNRFKWHVVPSNQEGFTILGPTKDYYEKQCFDFKYNGVTPIPEKSEDDTIEKNPDFEDTEVYYSKTLDEAGDDTSCTNKSSIVVLFQPREDKKYLFTGDASRDSFENMPDPQKEICKDIYWLKVPHHGSERNLNSALIKHLNPKIAYISTERIGRYADICTINALKKKGCKVMSTHKNQDLSSIFHNRFFPDGEFKLAEWC